MPVPTLRHTWSSHPIVKDYFWDKALKDLVEACSPSEYRSSDSSMSGVPLNRQAFETLIRDGDNGKGAMVPQRSVLRMRIQREEIPFYSLKFESKPTGINFLISGLVIRLR